MLRVQTRWTGVGMGVGYTNLHFSGEGGPAAEEVATAVRGFMADVAGQLSNTVQWAVQSEVLEIDPFTGTVEEVWAVTPGSGSGALAQPRVADSTQVLFRLRTGSFRGARRILGRFNVPGLPTTNLNAGGIGTGTVGFFETQFNDNLLAGTLSQDLVVWSRPNETTGLGGIAAPVISGSVWSELAVLRSRRS